MQVPHWRVLVIEAGPNEPTGSQLAAFMPDFFGSSIDWKYLTEPEDNACLNQPEQRCYWLRGKVTSVLYIYKPCTTQRPTTIVSLGNLT